MACGLAVVTGASRGLGRELALALAKEGYDLVVSARMSGSLETVRQEIVALNRPCLLWPGDLTGNRGRELRIFLESNPVDVLVNNAAAPPQLKCLTELTGSDYQRTFSLNLYVPYRLMQAAIKGMLPRKSGVIVNICSLAGRRAIRQVPLYCASKFALRGLTETVAQELENTGIRCFSVSPGGMQTQMRENIFHDASQQQNPAFVAQVVVDAITGRIPVPQGSDIVIRGGPVHHGIAGTVDRDSHGAWARRGGMRCRACGIATTQFLSLGQQPLPNRFLTEAELVEPEPRYPLDLHFCHGCSLVQLGTVVPPEDLFSEYLFASSTSPLTRAHFTGLAAHLKKKFHIDSDSKVVDIASNDGILLQAWRDLGVAAIGVEPAANLCGLAWAKGLGTLNEFFTRETVGKIGPESAHLVTAINVFAHVPEIKEFAENVRRLLRPDGVFVAEVQYLRDTITGLSFDNVYFEHVFYWTLTSLERVLASAGLHVIDAERVDTHGGSLRVYANTGEEYWSTAPARIKFEEEEMGLDRLETYLDFAKKVEGVRCQLPELLRRLRADGKVIAGYGAPAKATTLTTFCGIGPEDIPYIVDDSPLKQGLFTPGSHIRIVGPEVLLANKPDYLLLFAWNYAQAIIAKTRHLGAQYILPVPPRIVAE